MEEIVTEVFSGESNYSRSAYIILADDKVIFDDSEGEYGPIEFNLSLLEDKIKEHKEKIKTL